MYESLMNMARLWTKFLSMDHLKALMGFLNSHAGQGPSSSLCFTSTTGVDLHGQRPKGRLAILEDLLKVVGRLLCSLLFVCLLM